MSTRRERAARTRQTILDGAERLIAEQGYDATSTAQIAAAAGVPKTLVFHYFATKRRVLDAVLAERVATRTLDDVSPETSAAVRPGDTAAALVHLDETIRARLAAAPAGTQILLRESATQPAARRLFVSLCARIDTLVRATIDASLLGRAVPEDRLLAASQAFSAVLFRNLALERLTGAREEVAEVARLCARALHGPSTGEASPR